LCGDLLQAIICIAPPQHNEAMASIAPHLVLQASGKHQILLVPN
jgi:hypothetical protein